MIKFKISRSNDIDPLAYSFLTYEDIETIEYENEYKFVVVVTTKKAHNFKDGDIIEIVNEENDNKGYSARYYVDALEITYIDDTSFSFPAFQEYSNSIYSASTGCTTYYMSYNEDTNETVEKKLYYVDLELDYGHTFETYRNVEIKEMLTDGYYTFKGDTDKRKCANDFVLCEYFLYKSSDVTNINTAYYDDDTLEIVENTPKYIITDGSFYNTIDRHLYIYDNDGETVYLGGGTISSEIDNNFSAQTIDTEGLANGMLIVPSDGDGEDNKLHLFWAYNPSDKNDVKLMKYLVTRYNFITLYFQHELYYRENYEWKEYIGYEYDNDTSSMPDPSWFYEGYIFKYTGESDENYTYGTKYRCDNSLKLSLNTGNGKGITTTHFKYNKGTLPLTIPISLNFGNGIIKNNQQVIDDYLEKENEKTINKIIDYEKVVFNPVYINSEDLLSDYKANKDDYISFDEYLEKNLKDSNLSPVNSIKYNIHLRERTDYEEFETSISNYWNNYDEVNSNKKLVRKTSLTDDDADLIGYAGFTDDDVYYQKKKLSKTFIRIACYDSRNSGNQNLECYNTMFIDTGALYKKYINTLINTSYEEDNLVFNELTEINDIKDNRLDLSFKCTNKFNTEMSSEGFYLYMFPALVSGTTLTPLYLKINFNHAKYGKVIPLMRPVNEYNEPKTIENDFPYNYGFSDTDYYQLLGDMYLKIYIRYNLTKKEYDWFFPQIFDDDDIIINLFEPRMNGIKGIEANFSSSDIDEGIIDDGKREKNSVYYIYFGESNIISDTFSDGVIPLGKYEDKVKIYSVEITEGITTIAEKAFSGCTNLVALTFPNTITNIDNSAFAKCIGLTTVAFPSSVETLGDEIFVGCTNLKTVELKDGITNISNYMFKDCVSLNTITIPNSVLSIGYKPFASCSKLPVDNNIRYADTYAVEATDKTLSTYTFKSGVRFIGDECFYNCTNMTSITIPNTVITIGEDAFYKCSSLNDVTIGTSVTTIGKRAFGNCSSLTSITIPDSVTTINEKAFTNCQYLVSVTLPNKLEEIKNETFLFDSISSITIPDTVTIIGDKAFYATNLISVVIPDNVVTIGSYSFANCTLINDVTIGASVTDIMNYAFYKSTDINSVTLGESLINIGDYAFAYCEEITSIIIPVSVATIGNSAFAYCTKLTKITYKGTSEEWKNIKKGDNWWLNINDNTATVTITCEGDNKEIITDGLNE